MNHLGEIMNKKLITIICLIVLITSSFSMLVVNAAPGDIGYMRIELKDVTIIDNHESFPLGDGEIYFKFNMNGSEFRTANYEGIDDGENVTLNYVFFDSLVREGSNLFLFMECWEEDDADADDYVGEYNFTLLPIDFGDFIALYGFSETFVVTGTDAIFYLEVSIDQAPSIPPEKEQTPYITVTLVSAEIHNKHEAVGKGNGEIYFSYEIYGAAMSTEEYKDIEDGEIITTDLLLYQGRIFNDSFDLIIICFEADIDGDDDLGGFIDINPVFFPEWYRGLYGVRQTQIIPISDVTFTIEYYITYPAVPDRYEVIPTKTECVMKFNTPISSYVGIYYREIGVSNFGGFDFPGFYQTSHSYTLLNLKPYTAYEYYVITWNHDGEMYVDNNNGDNYVFYTVENLPVYTLVRQNLGIQEEFFKTLTGGFSHVNYSLGMYAGLNVPIIFEQQTQKYVQAGDGIESNVTITPEEGYAGAEVFGEISVYGYKIPLMEPESYYYDFTAPFGDLTIYTYTTSYYLGNLTRADSIYYVNLAAQIDVTFEIGVYLESNVTMTYSGATVNDNTASFIIDEPGETVTLTDTIDPAAIGGSEAICNANATLQFNNLYLRVSSLNLSVVGEIYTLIYDIPTVDYNIEIIGETAFFDPITFPVLKDALFFPLVLNHEDLETVSKVDDENPEITFSEEIKDTSTQFTLKVRATDNNAIFDLAAEVEYEDLQVQEFSLHRTIGSYYEFSFDVPEGESVDITITARDICGREFVFTYTHVMKLG